MDATEQTPGWLNGSQPAGGVPPLPTITDAGWSLPRPLPVRFTVPARRGGRARLRGGAPPEPAAPPPPGPGRPPGSVAAVRRRRRQRSPKPLATSAAPTEARPGPPRPAHHLLAEQGQCRVQVGRLGRPRRAPAASAQLVLDAGLLRVEPLQVPPAPALTARTGGGRVE